MTGKYIVLATVNGQPIYGLEPTPVDEKDMVTCSWCKHKFVEAHYPMVHDFTLSFEIGTTSDIFGPSTRGYEIEALCEGCAWKLKEKLIELGINIRETET